MITTDVVSAPMTATTDDQPESEPVEYVVAGEVFYHTEATGFRKRYNRGDRIRLLEEKARRLLRCGGIVPVGTPLEPQPTLVSYGDHEDIPWDGHTRKMIEKDVAEGRLRPPTGPHIFVR